MLSENNNCRYCSTAYSWLRAIVIVCFAAMISACAHPINITPSFSPHQSDKETFSTKVAGYVMNDLDRGKETITSGGGGDKVSYFPYRDLESGIRGALRTLYKDVVVVGSSSDISAIKRDGIDIVFSAKIDTTSGSGSIFTWPPTDFSVELSSTVTDAQGNFLTSFRAKGVGAASFSEFKNDFGLAGKRAAREMLEDFVGQIRANQQLK